MFQTTTLKTWNNSMCNGEIYDTYKSIQELLKNNLPSQRYWSALPDEVVQCFLMFSKDTKVKLTICDDINVSNEYTESYDPNHDEPFFWYTPSDEEKNIPRIDFAQIPKNAKILNKVDQKHKDEKAISTVLTENIRHKVRLYRTGNLIQIYTNSLTATLIRKIIVLLPQLYPNEGLTPIADNVLGNFTTDQPTEADYSLWLHYALEELKKTDLIKTIKIKELTKTINQTLQEKLLSYERACNDYRNRITQLEDSIEATYKSFNETNTVLQNLKLSKETSGAELYDYLTSNKSIAKWIPRQGQAILDLHIKTNLEYTDEAVLKRYLKDKRTFIYEHASGNFTTSVIEQIFTDLFITGTKKLYCGVSVYADLKNYRVGLNSFPDEFVNICPQPHLVGFSCWGDSKPRITKPLAEGNVISAVEQIITSAKNLNIVDVTVVKWLVKKLKDNCDKKWITDENGELKSIRELYMTPEGADNNE